MTFSLRRRDWPTVIQKRLKPCIGESRDEPEQAIKYWTRLALLDSRAELPLSKSLK
jgi:hypothetical protein